MTQLSCGVFLPRGSEVISTLVEDRRSPSPLTPFWKGGALYGKTTTLMGFPIASAIVVRLRLLGYQCQRQSLMGRPPIPCWELFRSTPLDQKEAWPWRSLHCFAERLELRISSVKRQQKALRAGWLGIPRCSSCATSGGCQLDDNYSATWIGNREQ